MQSANTNVGQSEIVVSSSPNAYVVLEAAAIVKWIAEPYHMQVHLSGDLRWVVQQHQVVRALRQIFNEGLKNHIVIVRLLNLEQSDSLVFI